MNKTQRRTKKKQYTQEYSEKWEETMAVKHMKFVLENPSHLNEKLCLWKATANIHTYTYNIDIFTKGIKKS